MGNTVGVDGRYKIKNWEEFQHFKNRTPPWIKLYKHLLDDPEWHKLDGDTAKFLVMIWLLASEDKQQKGCLPDINVISFRLRLDIKHCERKLNKLNHWVEGCDNNLISSCYQGDTPEKRRDREETEKKGAISLDELSVKHIEDWLDEKRASGEYIHHNPEFVLEQFKDYCRANGRRYKDYVAAYRNAFAWEKCKPKKPTNQKKGMGYL